MRSTHALHLLLPALLAASTASAQNFITNGHFENGSTGWSLTAFNDPAGTTGFADARTTGNGPSHAVFADFQTLTSVRSATYGGPTITLPQTTTLPVSFNVMWEKQVTTPIPSPSVNRVELRIFDSTNTRVFLGTLRSPNQTGLFERASFSGSFAVPAAGAYRVELFLRHSNLAGLPFICWVDDVVLGAPVAFVFGSGCQGSGGVTPVLNARNVPAINTGTFEVPLNDALAPTPALFTLGVSDTVWGGQPLPLALGGGCNVLSSVEVLFGGHVTTSSGSGVGTATQVLPIPNNPSLPGAQFFGQWFVVDPAAANPFGLVSTAAVGFTIQ